MIIERDEDVELVRTGTHTYVQVKTRNHPLRLSDVDTALERFDVLRDEHTHGRRSGMARFALVSNVEPGPELCARLAGTEWPGDVVLLWPDCPNLGGNLQLPAAWPDFAAGLQACMAQAALIPFGSLTPETLVLKLAGLVQYVAAGHLGHAVTATQVVEFFEQLVVQLQEFPEAPTNYRPQSHEPDLDAPGRVRLLIGVSGAGKTAWASRMALLHPSPAVYFDVGELPGSALASSLARELIARFLGGRTAGAGGAALPSASGPELLAALSMRLKDDGLEASVVLDNVHRLSAGTLRALVEAAPDIRFVMIGQHWTGQAELETRLGIQAETLGGWSLDTVVATFAAAGCPIDAPTGQRIIGITAGVPLYVNNAAQLAVGTYDGDVSRFLKSVEQRLNFAHTAQETILVETFEHLSSEARTAAALLDLSNVSLESDEALELIGTTGMSPQSIASAVRELNRYGVVQLFGGGLLKLHDSYRLLVRDGRETLPLSAVDAAREALVVMLQRSLPTQRTAARFGLWLRLLPQTGRIGTLIEVATEEHFHQIGSPQELKATLEDATEASTLSIEDQFWALDALVYWERTEGSDTRIADLVDRMVHLAGAADLGAREQVALSMKQMIAAALSGDRVGIETAYAVGAQQADGNQNIERLLRYNRAVSLFQLGAYEEVASIAFDLVMDYYDHLDLDILDIFGTNPSDISAVVPDTPNRDDDLRHTADCLRLLGMSHQELGQPAAMARLHAMKLYNAASAWRSSVHAGQEMVNELLILGDLAAARNIAESFLLPVVTKCELFDLLVQVRAQYAVVLAWCGELDAARNEMSALEAYQLSPIGAQKLKNQRMLIEQIAVGYAVLPNFATDSD